jgi:hypothetical protein
MQFDSTVFTTSTGFLSCRMEEWAKEPVLYSAYAGGFQSIDILGFYSHPHNGVSEPEVLPLKPSIASDFSVHFSYNRRHRSSILFDWSGERISFCSNFLNHLEQWNVTYINIDTAFISHCAIVLPSSVQLSVYFHAFLELSLCWTN